MPGFDKEIAKLAQRVLINPRKIDWHTGVLATKVTPGAARAGGRTRGALGRAARRRPGGGQQRPQRVDRRGLQQLLQAPRRAGRCLLLACTGPSRRPPEPTLPCVRCTLRVLRMHAHHCPALRGFISAQIKRPRLVSIVYKA